jgi:hypothetical protein
LILELDFLIKGVISDNEDGLTRLFSNLVELSGPYLLELDCFKNLLESHFKPDCGQVLKNGIIFI